MQWVGRNSNLYLHKILFRVEANSKSGFTLSWNNAHADSAT